MFGQFELDFLKFLEQLRFPLGNILFKYLTMLGEGPVIIVLGCVFYYLIDKDFGYKFIYTFSASQTFNGVVKNFVRMPRPFRRGISCVYEDSATGFSFPSGHSQSISVAASTVTKQYKKKWMLILSIVLILVVGFSRMYLGAHYPSDIVFGIIFGILWGIFGSIVYDKLGKNKAYLFTILAFLPFGIYFFFDTHFVIEYADMYKTYGVLIGAYLGGLLEEKHFFFDNSKLSIKRKLIRLLIALVFVGVVYIGLSKVFDLIIEKASLNVYFETILDFIRYGLVAFTATALAPAFLHKVHLD